MNYRMIQLTNDNIGAVAANSNIPLGRITRKISSRECGNGTFEVTTTGADTVILNEKGYYDVVYNATLEAGAAGLVTLNLVSNGTVIYTVSASADSGASVNVTIPFTIRVFGNCNSCPTNLPMYLQISSTGVAITDGSANLQIERRAD